jgi:thiamine-monophosphate kinase
MSEGRTEINELGEFGLIDRISSRFAVTNASSKLGIGDDAAIVDAGDQQVLVSTDMLVEGVHFDLSFTPMKHLGYKAVAVNVSDIAAMNATPTQITVSIAISNRFSLEAIDELYAGIHAACSSYKVDLVGGDTTSSVSGLILSITALGVAPKDQIVLRNGAKPNDIVCVTGDLGAAYLGLQILQREKEVFMTNPAMQPGLDKYEYLVGRQLKPEARMDVIYDLRELKVLPTSMIDVSDGLASELFHISRSSGIGVRIFEDKIPIETSAYETAAFEFKIDPLTCALNGGEDYELLFTIRQEDFEKIKNHQDIHMIGYTHEKVNENVLVTKQGNTVALSAQGWNHFAQEGS